jgi:hypothetical protein
MMRAGSGVRLVTVLIGLVAAACSRGKNLPEQSCEQAAAALARLALAEAAGRNNNDDARAVLGQLQTRGKFVLGKSIEGACVDAAVPAEARACVGGARSTSDARDCGAGAMVAAARAFIDRRLRHEPDQLPQGPEGVDCQALARHVYALTGHHTEDREQRILAVTYACASGMYSAKSLRCTLGARTFEEAEKCETERSGLQHPSLTTPSHPDPRAPPPPVQ